MVKRPKINFVQNISLDVLTDNNGATCNKCLVSITLRANSVTLLRHNWECASVLRHAVPFA